MTTTGRTATVFNFEVESTHDYYVQLGLHFVLVHNECSIALGRSEVGGNPIALQDFADSVGAKSYHDWPSRGDNWVTEFKGYVKNGRTQIHFNLDGIDDPVAAARVATGMDPIFDGHATAWELSVIRDNPSAWPRVTFYRGGQIEQNPFSAS